MSDLCLDFEELLVEIKLNFLDKKEKMSERLWYAANSAYTKLTKYYVKIGSKNYALARKFGINRIVPRLREVARISRRRDI
jgi:hypothetical protein